jgi:hypothetical protein
MSSSNLGPKCPNFPVLNSLFSLLESPLPRPPGYSAGRSASYPEINSYGCSARCPVRNPESYQTCYSVSSRASDPERNSVSCSENFGACSRKRSPSDCPAKRRARSPASNLPDCRAGSLENCLEGCSAASFCGSTADALTSSYRRPLGEHDLADGLRLSLRFGCPHKYTPGACAMPFDI